MLAAMGHKAFFSPQREAAMPPMMPPTVSAMTPMVP